MLSDKQYAILLDLFHEFNEEFQRLSQGVKDQFYARLYNHGA